MKKLKLILFFLLLTFSLKAQNILAEEKKVDYKNIVYNLYEFKTYNFNNFFIRVCTYDNGSGSAHLAESDEASSSILISKSGYGEEEIPKFYVIHHLINFKIKSVTENQIKIKDKMGKRTITYSF